MVRYGGYQPPINAQVDWGHPLARGLASSIQFCPYGAIDHLGNSWTALNGSPTIGANGLATTSASSGEQIAEASALLDARLRSEFFTLFVEGQVNTIAAVSSAMASHGTDCGIVCGYRASATDAGFYRRKSGSWESVTYAQSGLIGRPLKLAQTYDGVSIRVWDNGRELVTGGTSGILYYNSTGTAFSLGGYRWNQASHTATYRHAHLYTRGMSASELAWLTTEPYAMFYSETSRVYSIPASGVVMPIFYHHYQNVLGGA